MSIFSYISKLSERLDSDHNFSVWCYQKCIEKSYFGSKIFTDIEIVGYAAKYLDNLCREQAKKGFKSEFFQELLDEIADREFLTWNYAAGQTGLLLCQALLDKEISKIFLFFFISYFFCLLF